MQIKILGKIPNTITLACSGGPDSMVVFDFLKRSKRDITLAYFNHGTEHGQEAEEFVRAHTFGYPLVVGGISREKNKEESLEEYWRNERYRFFNELSGPIITCHHLDDCIETWIFSSLHGRGRLIPRSSGNVIRPFLLTKKADILTWAKNNSVSFATDPSNEEVLHMRNLIRHTIVPQAFKVNPGLHKTLTKLILNDYRASENN